MESKKREIFKEDQRKAEKDWERDITKMRYNYLKSLTKLNLVW